MKTGEQIPIRFYESFYDVDYSELPSKVKEALVKFLQQLQMNPDSPEILAHAQTERGRYAYSFFPGYIIFWRVVRRTSEEFISLDSARPVRIEVLAIVKT